MERTPRPCGWAELEIGRCISYTHTPAQHHQHNLLGRTRHSYIHLTSSSTPFPVRTYRLPEVGSAKIKTKIHRYWNVPLASLQVGRGVRSAPLGFGPTRPACIVHGSIRACRIHGPPVDQSLSKPVLFRPGSFWSPDPLGPLSLPLSLPPLPSPLSSPSSPLGPSSSRRPPMLAAVYVHASPHPLPIHRGWPHEIGTSEPLSGSRSVVLRAGGPSMDVPPLPAVCDAPAVGDGGRGAHCPTRMPGEPGGTARAVVLLALFCAVPFYSSVVLPPARRL